MDVVFYILKIKFEIFFEYISYDSMCTFVYERTKNVLNII